MQTNGKLRRNGPSREAGIRAGRIQAGEKHPPESTKPDSKPTHKEFLLDALDRFERPLTAYAKRLLAGDEHAARDIVQHTFLQLCKQPPQTVANKLAPWLYTVCRNRILDELKSNSRQSTSSLTGFDTIDANAFDPAKQFEVDEFLQNLRKLFQGLPQPECEVIELWSHGLDATEIADILKKNQGSVRVNLHRAIKRLKQHPEIANWLERATGQVVRPDVGQPKKSVPAANCNESSTPFSKGERS